MLLALLLLHGDSVYNILLLALNFGSSILYELVLYGTCSEQMNFAADCSAATYAAYSFVYIMKK